MLTWQLCDLEQEVLATLSPTHRAGAKVSGGVNKGRAATVEISLNDPAVDDLSAQDTLLRVLVDGWDVPLFTGRVVVPQGQRDAGAEGYTINALDPWAQLEKNFHAGTYGGISGYYVTTYFAATDQAQIMWALIDALDTGHGIVAGSLDGGSVTRDRAYLPGKQISEALIQMAEVSGGPDFELAPATPRAVRVATAAGLPAHSQLGGILSATSNGALTIDGVAMATDDEALVKNEGGGSHQQNGPYRVANPGSPSTQWVLVRVSDEDAQAELENGVTVTVEEGTQAGTYWTLATRAPITVNTTALVFEEIAPPLVAFNTYHERQGTDRSATVIFEHGFGDQTALTFSPSPSGELLCNRCTAVGQQQEGGFAGDHYAVQVDHADSIAAYGVFEEVLTFGDIGEPTTLQEHAEAVVAARAYPIPYFEFTCSPDGPTFAPESEGGDFWQGDTISVDAKLPRDETAVRYSGRVTDWELVEQPNGEVVPKFTCQPEITTDGLSATTQTWNLPSDVEGGA